MDPDPAARPLLALPRQSRAATAGPAGEPPDGPGLRIACLAYDTLGIPSAQACSATLVLGWDPECLALQATVQAQDLTACADPTRLYRGTSLELFLRTAPAWHHLVQVVVSPGTDPGQGTLQTQFFDERGALPAGHDTTRSCTIQALRTATGYDLALRLPWRLIDLEAVSGALCECKITLNWHRHAALRIQGTWRGPGGEDFHRLQLAGPGARPEATRRAAWLALEPYHSVVLATLGPAADAGRVVTIRQRDTVLAAITLAGGDGRSQGSVTLPLAVLDERAPLQVDGVDGVIGTCRVPDFRAELRQLVDHALAHPPWSLACDPATRAAHGVNGDFCFQGGRFPVFAVAGAAVRAALDLTIERSWWVDAQGSTVTHAAVAGRYGLLIALSYADPTRVDADGSTRPRCRRLAYHTVVRLPDAPQAVQELCARALALRVACHPHPSAGRAGAESDGARSLATDPDVASSLAVAGEGLQHGGGLWAQERAWWHEVRRRAALLETYGCLVTLPHLYQRLPTHRWPALIVLHGSGAPDSPLTGRTPEVIQRHAESVPDFPFVVLGLQTTTWWEPGLVAQALQRACADYRLDAQRIILMGFSMGGFGTWQTLIDFPQLFAAGVPISGGPGEPWAAARLAHLPLWCWNGADDRTTTAAQTEQMLAALRAAGGNPRHTVVPGCDHLQVPVACAASGALWSWLEAQRRAPHREVPTGDGKAGA